MTCRICNEKDDFCDGNASEELCKHCLDHCCEECFLQLETDAEYEHNVCSLCYTKNFWDLPSGLYPNEPEVFTFSDQDIAAYEEECRSKKIVEDACEKKKQQKAEKKRNKWNDRWQKALSKFSFTRKKGNDDLAQEMDELNGCNTLCELFEIEGDVTEGKIIEAINNEEVLEREVSSEECIILAQIEDISHQSQLGLEGLQNQIQKVELEIKLQKLRQQNEGQ